MCSDSPTGPSTPSAIALACPAPSTVASASGLPVIVTFSSPTATGGTSPLTMTCSPSSGALFPLGSTPITCRAVDARQQTATCTFTVTVTGPPRMTVTRFIAFGDSITEGFPHTISPALVDPPPPGSYPLVLQSLLQARYTAQAIAVLDEGVGGEIVSSGVARLPGALAADKGGALLLMEGANDLNQFGADGVSRISSGLQTMIRMARARSMVVFVGTLLPERANGTPARATHPELVVPANAAIRSLAAAEGVTLVDLFTAFGGVPDPVLISSDGLHPTAAGNERIAQTFYASIRARLESTAAPVETSGAWQDRATAGLNTVPLYHR
ncbi:MAG TPA: GDSL-type esterase/lipase family protein [Vicinamibacterales bacterium]|nr:GDSL-type esterase/lipase family protein [Vicinamibacterales bacterium]